MIKSISGSHRWRVIVSAAWLLVGIALATAAAQPPSQAGKHRKAEDGEIITPPARGERIEDHLKVGDLAPDFTLADPQGKAQVKLSSFRGRQPVVLVFGSFT
jgi:hypothetical protein